MVTPAHATKEPNGNPSTDAVLLEGIGLKNFLSFGLKEVFVNLRPLNVLVGPNGSGKSNFIEAISLLRSAPSDMRDVVRKGGGVQEWIWKGNSKSAATLSVIVSAPDNVERLIHSFSFTAENQAFRLSDEYIENADSSYNEHYFYYMYMQGRPFINIKGQQHSLTPETIQTDASILSQRRDPEQYPEITYLSEQYTKIRTYREWSFGRNTVFREPQRADMRNDRLEEDFSNLGLFLNRLRRDSKAKSKLLNYLRNLYDGVRDVDVSIEGGTVQVFIEEAFSVPASRLSDGTLRYLCLLAILCDPSPPPLICIEEPELGLHPDIIPSIADLLVDASSRTQLVVTTHSDILIDSLTQYPESVLIFEKQDGQTHVKRLDREDLSVWLEKYKLGELWIKGELGGTRW